MNNSKKLTNLLLLCAFFFAVSTQINAQESKKINFEIQNQSTSSDVWDNVEVLANMNGTVQVRWQFPNPLRIDHFIVQKSIDNQTFKGTSEILPFFNQNGPTIYKRNLALGKGQTYYIRVLAITKGGTILPSEVIKVLGFGVQDVEVNTFPNPATEFMTVTDLYEDAQQIVIYDQRGTIQLTKTINSFEEQTTLDVQNLDQGFHQLVVTDQSGKIIQSKRILIQ